MNSSLRTTAGVLAAVTVPTLVVVGIFVGCRGDYGTTSMGGGDGDFLATGRTLSFFRAIQVDPKSEDSAGPQFVVAEDLNNDGLLDLVSAWNQSQPIQIHLQHRSDLGAISFETLTLAGNIPAVAVSGLAVTDFNQDDHLDIAVLLKHTLLSDAACLDSENPDAGGLSGLILLYIGPDDPEQANQALAWREVPIEASRLVGAGTFPSRL